MRWINATQLEQWADAKTCETLLPELIRKLIIASCNPFPDITIPAGDSIYKPGWDGRCNTEAPAAYVPAGQSLWEFGRDEDFKAKCRRDFNKRTEETAVSIQETSAYVFVTPRRWVKAPLKEEWIAANRSESNWKEIKVYDADDLESWIEQHPAVGLWLARELRQLPPAHIQSATDYWHRFTQTKSCTLTPEAIIAGRESEQIAIQEFLSGPYGVKEVQASSTSEAIAFTIAAEISKGDNAAQDFFSTAMCVTDLEALRSVASQHEGLVIIFDGGRDEVLSEYDAQRNHLVVPVSYKVKSSGITIPIPSANAFTKSLESLGFDWRKANELTREAGRSFSVLKRLLTEYPGRVPWSQGHDLAELIPIFLLQRFDDGKEGDREIVAKLSRTSYGQYKEQLKKWSLISDSPVYQIANHWRVVSSYDLLFVLARYITEEHLRLFEEVVFQVLGEKDPALELEPNMRMAAAVFKKDSRYSKKMQRGIGQTLALLSVHGEEAGVHTSIQLQSWIDGMVQQLLSKYELDFWQSIEGKLHLLAEASPQSFLRALEGLVKQKPTLVGALFDDQGYDIFSPTYHTHLLWALESLAWDPHYLGRVVMLLAELVKLDQGGKTANRPINSLRYIFLLWLPQTYAAGDVQQSVIDTLIRKKGEVAFQLLKEIAPRQHDTGFHSHKPIWRLRDQAYSVITREELAERISFVCDRLIQISGQDLDKWTQLIDLFDDFFGDDRTRLINAFTAISVPEAIPSALLDKLREFIHRHECYSEQAWALEAADVAQLKAYYKSLLRNDIDRYYWYFNVDTIERRRNQDSPYQELLHRTINKRTEALATIVESLGFEGVLALARKVEHPFVVGNILARLKKDMDQELLIFLTHEEEKLQQMATGYYIHLAEEREFDWVKELASLLKLHYSDAALTAFFLSIAPAAERWQLLEATSADAYGMYWEKVFKDYGYPRLDSEVHNQCIRILNSFGRYTTSLNLMRYEHKETPPEIIIETLLGLIKHPPEEGARLTYASWLIVELFKRLDEEDVDEETMQRLEWHYLELLSDGHNRRPIRHLFKLIGRDPSFFSDLIAWIYLPESRNPEEEMVGHHKSIKMQLAQTAQELLDAWADLPGQNEQGEIDQQKLKQWIEGAIQECKAKDREKMAYYEIGKLFGKLKDTWHNWPMPELCELMEEYDHEKMWQGFFMGVNSGSGTNVTYRSANGGSPERATAARYRALAAELSAQYPSVARQLVEVERYYESWANHMDKDEAQRNLEY